MIYNRMNDEIRIIIEGPEISKVINRLFQEKIAMKRIKYLSDTKVELICIERDFEKIEKLLKNKYEIETVGRRGKTAAINKLKNRKTTVLGVIIFILLLVYQSFFISGINITGLNKIDEAEVLSVLKDNGIYVGCKKGTYNMEAVEFDIFDRVKGISWMELRQEGGIITVDIVEAKDEVEKETNTPSNIVARKSGYIDEIITINGQKVVEIGQYVTPGDLLISGELVSKIDETSKRYVRAKGQVFGRCIYSFEKKEPVEIEAEELTGRFYPGVKLRFGDIVIDSGSIINIFDESCINEKKIVDLNVPLPLSLSVTGNNETEMVKRKRSISEIKRTAEIELIKELKKIMGQEGRIVKKDLQFREEENIIVVKGVFEVIEEIGGEEPIIYERIENTD